MVPKPLLENAYTTHEISTFSKHDHPQVKCRDRCTRPNHIKPMKHHHFHTNGRTHAPSSVTGIALLHTCTPTLPKCPQAAPQAALGSLQKCLNKKYRITTNKRQQALNTCYNNNIIWYIARIKSNVPGPKLRVQAPWKGRRAPE